MADIRDTDESPTRPPSLEDGGDPPDLSPDTGPDDPLEGGLPDDPADGYETRYDPTRDDSLVCVIVDAVATAAGCDPLEVEPLYDCLDPEALEGLFAPRRSAEARAGSVSFPIHDHVVTVVDGDRVRVEPGEWRERHA
ncbi:HalOD1 output domain-containing protein [Natrononativus amylolyticus]|uniref:HalOD1 output domain-containing protein n=1 Tax=Natrononativus amylolyticus TaxID=2963434 RepID=UPI0020CC6BB9|nr:HalOD1 output domain-containing protein [Natrononativus amylolyticus]